MSKLRVLGLGLLYALSMNASIIDITYVVATNTNQIVMTDPDRVTILEQSPLVQLTVAGLTTNSFLFGTTQTSSMFMDVPQYGIAIQMYRFDAPGRAGLFFFALSGSCQEYRSHSCSRWDGTLGGTGFNPNRTQLSNMIWSDGEDRFSFQVVSAPVAAPVAAPEPSQGSLIVVGLAVLLLGCVLTRERIS